MIPKKIHYVWVGGQQKPKAIQKCMKTWQKHLSGFEIIEWNEKNFDINSHPFAKAAYEAKKWAYVSDYIRAYVIYNEGGIYLDTDVIVLEDLTTLLSNKAFVGYEEPNYPFTAVFGAIPKHPLLKKILDYYDNVEFAYDSKDEMKNVNTKIVSDILVQEYNCKLGNQEQLLKDGIKVYQESVLCNPSAESKTIHVFTGTWMEEKMSIKRKIIKMFKPYLKTKFSAGLYRKYYSSKKNRKK